MNTNDTEASGVLYTLLLNAFPAIVYLFNYRRIGGSSNSRKIWIIMSLLALTCFPLLLILRSTATYRLSLYFIPIQIYVGSYLPDLGFLSLSKNSIVNIIIFLSFMTLGTWLLFASHSTCWLPYQNILFQQYF